MAEKYISKKIHFSKWNVLNFGKYKGMKIVDILKENPTYVLDFLIKKCGHEVVDLNPEKERRKLNSMPWGYKPGKGLVCNYCFYREYLVSSKSIEGNYWIKDSATGTVIQGKNLGDCENKMNIELTKVYEGV